MKKLLGLFAVTTLSVSSSCGVIACGKKLDFSNEDAVLITKNLINEFISEIGKITFDHFDSIKTHFTRFVGNDYGDFFTKENIIKYGTEKNSNNELGDSLSNEQLQEISIIFLKLASANTLENEINKLATATDKYSIIINGGKVVSNINFDSNTFIMNYVDKQIFLASASLTMSISFTYLDFNNVIVNATTKNNLSLKITDDKQIEIGINKLEADLANDLIKESSDVAWNTAKSFQYSDEDLYKVFELYDDQKRAVNIATLLKNPEWQSKINTFINNMNYFENSDTLGVKLDFTSSKVANDNLINKIEPKTYTSVARFYEKYYSLRSAIFEKLQVNDSLTFISKTIKGNKDVYDVLNENFQSLNIEFGEKNKENLPWYEGPNLDKDNILLAKTNINNLELNFENLNFTLPINSFTLIYSVSLTGELFDVEQNKTLESSQLGEAFYKNVEAGILAFQKNFGVLNVRKTNSIITHQSENESGINQLIAYNIPLKMTGTTTDNEQALIVNIFDELPSDAKSETVANKVNTVLSLQTDKLSPVKSNLLRDGFQGNFGLKLLNYNWAAKNLQELSSDAGFNFVKTKPSTIPNTESFEIASRTDATGDDAVALSFKLDLSLLSICIVMPELTTDKSYYEYQTWVAKSSAILKV